MLFVSTCFLQTYPDSTGLNQEAIKLKEVVKMYERDEKRNHPNIIKIGDRPPKNLNMGDYTVITPTRPVTPSIYPDINEHPTQY